MAALASDIEALPDALTSREQWVCWRAEERDGKTTKVPVDPSTSSYASTTDQTTWTTIETALEAASDGDVDGVGFVFTDDDPLVGIDLDDCRDPDSRTIDEWARDIVTRLDSYAEVSPSGTGVHVIAEGELPDGRSRSGDVEMYETSRFFTVTGEHLDQTPRQVHRRVDAIRDVHAEYVQESVDDIEGEGGDESAEGREDNVNLDDEELIERARSAENGDRFDALWRGQTGGYDSHSEADMALCIHLAFWTGGDSSRMDTLFRRSGLMREKWDEVHFADGSTYGERTIERALQRVDEVYDPDAKPTSGATDSILLQHQSEAGDPPVASGGQENEVVYLEERNRLLRDRIRTQQATIEEQAARIRQLEQEIEAIRRDSAVRVQHNDSGTEESGRWYRLSTLLGKS